MERRERGACVATKCSHGRRAAFQFCQHKAAPGTAVSLYASCDPAESSARLVGLQRCWIATRNLQRSVAVTGDLLTTACQNFLRKKK